MYDPSSSLSLSYNSVSASIWWSATLDWELNFIRGAISVFNILVSIIADVLGGLFCMILQGVGEGVVFLSLLLHSFLIQFILPTLSVVSFSITTIMCPSESACTHLWLSCLQGHVEILFFFSFFSIPQVWSELHSPPNPQAIFCIFFWKSLLWLGVWLIVGGRGGINQRSPFIVLYGKISLVMNASSSTSLHSVLLAQRNDI